MASEAGKGRRERNIVVTVAALIAIGLAWGFLSGSSDKEDRIKVALALAKAREAGRRARSLRAGLACKQFSAGRDGRNF